MTGRVALMWGAILALGLAACSGPAATPTPAPTPAPSVAPASPGPSPSAPAPSASGVASPEASGPLLSPIASPLGSPIATLPPALGLEDREWLLVKAFDGSGMVDVPGDLRLTITLVDGVATGDSGCNTFRGSYTSQLDQIVFGILATTTMACEEDAMRLESAYLQTLGQVARFGALDTGMAFFDPVGIPVLAYVPAPTGDLVGEWRVVSYQDTRGALVSPLPSAAVTIAFAPDGTLSGSDGCNSYTGTYETTGPRIELAGLSGTRAACPSPELTSQEEQFLAALQASTLWTATPTTLTMRGMDGIRTLALERMPGG